MTATDAVRALGALAQATRQLAHAGLVVARQENRFIYYSVDFERMNKLLAFLTQNCCEGGGNCEIPAIPVAPPRRKRA